MTTHFHYSVKTAPGLQFGCAKLSSNSVTDMANLCLLDQLDTKLFFHTLSCLLTPTVRSLRLLVTFLLILNDGLVDYGHGALDSS